MIDPISIVGAAGFALQAIDFILGALDTLGEKTRATQEYERRIAAFSLIYKTCIVRLESWLNVWWGYERETYEHFWGPSAFQEIERSFAGVCSLARDIEEEIFGRTVSMKASPQVNKPARSFRRAIGNGLSRVVHKYRDKEMSRATAAEVPTTPAWTLWQDLLLHFQEPSRPKPELYDAGIIEKIAFGFFRSAILEERLDNLQKQSVILEEFTRSMFRTLRSQDESCRVDTEDLKQSREVQKDADSFNEFALSLHVALQKSDGVWAIELRRPTEKGPRPTRWQRGYLDLSLQSISGRYGDQMPTRLRVSYPTMTHDQGMATELSSLLTRRENATLMHSHFIDLLPPHERLSRPFKELLLQGVIGRPGVLKAWEEDQADLLRSFAHWTVQLLNTPWTSSLCSCGVRFHDARVGSREYSFSTCKEGLWCNGSQTETPRLLLVALVLAELALATPLRVSPEPTVEKGKERKSARVSRDTLMGAPGRQLEELQTMADGHHWQHTCWDDILQRIRSRPGAHRIYKAIEYCVDRSVSIPTKYRQHKTETSRGYVQPEILQQIVNSSRGRRGGSGFYRLPLGQWTMFLRLDSWKTIPPQSP
ncbi:hypothetical protein K402DRAFT_9279 [Aulographum hederae CBS 113979]|uniref:Uncharacterized protein n=1 Tax=Aulographum hederae CBS 113979 TaxID=1176131 RepID=A0A6G1HHR9_9PEZI|nr:hypothetical protein K402DRAFT_9279 [Aulographum hederae CBS 113979]